MSRPIVGNNPTKYQLRKIRETLDENVQARINQKIEEVRQQLSIEAYNKVISRRAKPQNDVDTTLQQSRNIRGIVDEVSRKRGRPIKTTDQEMQEAIAANQAHFKRTQEKTAQRKRKNVVKPELEHTYFTHLLSFSVVLEVIRDEIRIRTHNNFRLSKRVLNLNDGNKQTRALTGLTKTYVDNQNVVLPSQITNGIRENQKAVLDEIKSKIEFTMASYNAVFLSIENIDIAEYTSEEVNWRETEAFAEGEVPSYMSSPYISLDLIVGGEKAKSDDLYMSCWLNLLVRVYKTTIEKYYKKQKITHETVAFILNPRKPLKPAFNGYCFDEVINFFRQFGIGLYLLDHEHRVREYYKPPIQNRNINPYTLYAIMHQGHIYPCNKLQSLSQKVVEKIKPMDQLVVSPSANYYIKERDETIDSILVNGYDDIVKILNDETITGVKYVVFNGGDMYHIYKQFLECGIKPHANICGNRVSFDSMTLMNINKKTLRISNMVEKSVTECNTFKSQESFNAYQSRKNWLSNNLINPKYLSNYSEDVKAMLGKYVRGGIIGGFQEYSGNCIQLDFNKYYTSLLMKIKFAPVENSFDHFVDCVAGEKLEDTSLYFVEKLTDDYLYPPSKFNLCWGFNLKGVKNIRFIAVNRPSVILPVDFVQVVEAVYNDKNLTETGKKNSFNENIGKFGQINNHAYHTLVTTDQKEVNTFLNEFGGNCFQFKELWFHTIKKSTELENGFRLLQSMIYDMGHKGILDLKEKVESFGLEVYGVNTDCIYLGKEKPNGLIFENDLNESCLDEFKKCYPELFNYKDKGDFDAIGKLKIKLEHKTFREMVPKNEADLYPHYKHEFQKVNHMLIEDEFETDRILEQLLPNTLVVAEVPGAGKTTLFKKLSKIEKTLIVVPYNTLKQELSIVDNVESISVNNLLGIIWDGHDNTYKAPFDIKDYKNIVFDEVYMNEPNRLAQIGKIMRKYPDKRFYGTGDNFQNESLENLSVKDRDAYYEMIMTELFPNRITLKICKRCRPEDRERISGMCKAIRHGDKTDIFNILKTYNIVLVDDINLITTKRNICHSNDSCDVVNTFCQAKFHPTEPYVVGGKLICRTSIQRKNVRTYINYRYDIVDVKEKLITISDSVENFELTREVADNNFKMPYAQTGHSLQGLSVKEPYTIFNIRSPFVSMKWIYTALTRTTNLDNIQIFMGKLDDGDGINKLKSQIERRIESHKNTDKLEQRPCVGAYVNLKWVLDGLKNSKCKYCLLDFNITEKNSVSIDRINNALGHTISNCQLICRSCNNGKKDYEGVPKKRGIK
jgi:hypothetical protein